MGGIKHTSIKGSKRYESPAVLMTKADVVTTKFVLQLSPLYLPFGCSSVLVDNH